MLVVNSRCNSIGLYIYAGMYKRTLCDAAAAVLRLLEGNKFEVKCLKSLQFAKKLKKVRKGGCAGYQNLI